jgi:CubicO group peptidase (beta-lactamase class C family)
MGIDKVKVDELRARAQREIDEGLLPSCQIALGYQGEIVAHDVYGDASLDTRYIIFSATKAFVASAAWILIGEGSLDIGKRVSDYIPEFATNGKQDITVEQVMLHTSGFPHAPLGPPAWFSRERRLEAFAKWRLNWEPGTKFEYHPTSAHWVLAELIERAAGADYNDFLADRVTGALGLPRMLALAPEEQTDIADLEHVGEPPTSEELMALFGISEWPVTEVTDDALYSSRTEGYRKVGIPGGGGIANAATVALFYQGLLHDKNGIWDEEVLRDATSNVRNNFPDLMTGAPASRGLGVVIAGEDGKAHMRGMGKTQGPRTFGHNGAGGQIAWVDPDSGLSFCYLTNGNDRHVIRQARRGVALSSRAAICATD